MNACRIGLWPLKLLARLPFPLLYGLSNVLASFTFHIVRYRREVVLNNLTLAFPEWTPAQRKKVARDFYFHFTDLILESVKSLHLSEKEIRQRLVLKNPEVFERLQAQQRGVMVVWGHYTNFEWMAMGLPLLIPQSTFAVYHPLSNACFGQTVVRIREQFGLQLFPMAETYPFMLNNPVKDAAYIFMADQSPSADRLKYFTNFFGQQTPVHLGVENLARKMDLAVVFLYAERKSRGFYHLRARLLTDHPQSMPMHAITDTHVQWLEEEIRQKPADWLWSHKRWKHRKR